MATISAYPVLDFKGGIRRDKSPLEMDRTELLDARNVEIDELGRVKTRRGSFQYGNTLTGTLDNSFVFTRLVTGGLPTVSQIVASRASPTVLSRVITSRLTTSITPASTTVVVQSTSTSDAAFAASGTIEIEGDLIAYTSLNGDGVTFDGVTGITSSHAAGASVHQYVTISQATNVDGRNGVYFAVLNNTLVINGRVGVSLLINNDDGITTSNITGEPAGLFATNYRERMYMAGDGTSGTNGGTSRVSFSNRGDPATWTTASDYFDVEEQRGEFITGLRVLNDRMLIFKMNSTFVYDEIQLKQYTVGVGAYNHRVTQEINSICYTFCPEGIFATTGSEAKQIGDPVKEYWKNFLPVYDTTKERVVLNCFSGKFEDNYLLYIGNVTEPTTQNDVVLVYNTTAKNWRVYQGLTNFTHFGSFDRWRDGDAGKRLQDKAVLFAGDSGGKYWRMFESRYLDNQSTPVKQGGDVFKDLVSDTGVPVSTMIETPLYDMGQPSLFKIAKRLRVYSERGLWSFEYRVENEKEITPYKPLGVTTKTNQVLDLPTESAGYRIGLRISAVNSGSQSILNGFVFEDVTVNPRA